MGFSVETVLPVAVGAVAIVLGLGLINMVRGGDPRRSQRLMRWRVALQAVAVVAALVAIWLTGR